MSPAPAEAIEAAAPYVGLRPFEPNEWTIFFGRESIIVDVVGRMGAQNLVFVHGGSGCGKSSLVRAGMLPMLRNDHELVGRQFEHRIMRPSEGPLAALAGCLAGALGPPEVPKELAEEEGGPDPDNWDDVQAWQQRLLFSPDPVAEIEAVAAAKGIESFCLVIDQFEEVFQWTRDRGPAEVQVLVDLMHKAAKGGEGRHFFILATMRSDYIGDCAQFPGLASVINDCQFFLPSLSEVGLLRCIVEPAKLFGGTVEGPLADRLRMAASTQPDSLPALQHVLMRMASLHKGETGWTLTREDFQAVGGTSALSQHADELFDALVEEENGRSPGIADGMCRIFRALVDVDPAGRGVRRPTELSKLVAISGLERDVVERIVGRFAAEGNNLLVRSVFKVGGETEVRVDISHEALLRNWTRMTGSSGRGGWLRDEVDDGLRWRALAVTARSEGASLGMESLRDYDPWYKGLEQCPERARRYLIAREGKDRVRDEAEWIAVAGLFARSRGRKKLRDVGMFLFGLLIIGLVVYGAVRLVSGLSRQVQLSQQLSNQQEALEDLGQAETSDLAEDKRIDAATRELVETMNQAPAGSVPAELREKIQTLAGAAQVGEARSGLVEDRTGWVWIGSAAKPNLIGPGNRPVPPASVRVGETYTAVDDMTVREGTPDEKNRSRPTITVAVKGWRVKAIAAPVRAQARQDQYWLKVAVIPTGQSTRRLARVYPQFAALTSKADDLVLQLSADYRVERAEILTQAEGLNEVRYCHDSDSAQARRLAAEVEEALDRPIGVEQLRRCSSTAPGTLELWVGRP